MEDQDPIKQLQSLLTDRGKVLERISGIQAVLNSIKGATTETSIEETTGIAKAEKVVPTEDPYARLLHMLQDMQSQIENQVRPLAQQSVHLEIERLRERAVTERSALQTCLDHLDQCLATCVERAEEYRREHAGLAQLSQRLAALGAMPESLPECPPDNSDIVHSRLELLTRQGKI